MTEIYKQVKKFPYLYLVSNLGNVKSLPKGDGNGNRERILIPDTSTPYLRVTLSDNGKTVRVPIHVLVAQSFIPNPDNKPFVNHKDLDKRNNNVSNLEWCTQSENAQHAYLNGVLTGIQKGADALKVKAFQCNSSKGLLIYKDNFITVFSKPLKNNPTKNHWYFKYHCSICRSVSELRVDSKRLNKTSCKSCNKLNK